MVDYVCEPFMASIRSGQWLTMLFGSGKGSGAALMMFLLGVAGTIFCLVSGKKLKQYEYSEE